MTIDQVTQTEHELKVGDFIQKYHCTGCDNKVTRMEYIGRASFGDIPESLSEAQKQKLRVLYQARMNIGNYKCVVCGSNNAILDGLYKEQL